MNDQFAALWEFHGYFSARNIRNVVIGGVAVQHWGEPRFTRDIDMTILIDVNLTEKTVKDIAGHFKPRISDAVTFALKNRILLLTAANGVEADISLGLPGYEETVYEHSIDYELEPGKSVKMCGAEDLIIHKCVAGRPRDLEDVGGIIARQGKKLDAKYIRKWLKQFSAILENDLIKRNFEDLLKKQDNRPRGGPGF